MPTRLSEAACRPVAWAGTVATLQKTLIMKRAQMTGRTPVLTGLLAALLVVAASAACREKATTGPAQRQSKDFAAAVRSVSGDQQVGAAGARLAQSLTVRVVDAGGNPVSGAAVAFQVRLGGGSVNPPANTSSDSGLVRTVWTLGTAAGPNKVVAILTNGAIVDSALFTATATAGTGVGGSALLAFSDVKAGNFQACGVVASNNRAYCWGLNDVGQLGKGVFANTTAPSTAVATAADTVNGPFGSFRQITGGRSFFCGLSTGRQIFCWGNVFNSTPTNIAVVAPFPFNFANLLAAGEDHNCLLSLSGVAYCAGGNEQGQLGDTTFANRADYKEVFPFNGLKLWSNIVSGRNHTCAIPRFDGTVASQSVWCWGLNSSGQLGDGTFIRKNQPTMVPVVAFDSASLTAGGAHTCAVTPSGLGYCWGSNGFGQLGTGSTSNSKSAPVQVVAAPSGLPYKAIYAGEFHTCAIDTVGNAYCWGRDDFGQLGDGTRTQFNTGNASPVAVTGGYNFRSLSLGELYTCGVAAAPGDPIGPSSKPGTVYCWGDNIFGQIGNGQASGGNAPVLTPSKVLGQP